jgi:hypothetical protein
VQAQVDYEAAVHLAVFRSESSAEGANRALEQTGIEHTLGPLLPGRYQVADPRLRRYTRAIVGAAIAGAVVGVVVGIGLALWFFGAAWQIATWFAVAGAIGGAVIGGLVGLQVRARYDADVAEVIDVPTQPPAFVITAYTQRSDVRAILERAGAVAFLDVASYEARERPARGTVVESTSSGGT